MTNIKTHIPLVLDLDVFNYDAWRELLLTHCLTFDVLGHLDGTSQPTDDDDLVWRKRDGLVKMWIYGTLAKPLFKTSFKTGDTARDIWLRIENQFRNNKESRAIQLDNDLRTKEIGDQSIHEYSQDLKSIADLLENVDAPVSDKTLVMYLLNGLRSDSSGDLYSVPSVLSTHQHSAFVTETPTLWHKRLVHVNNDSLKSLISSSSFSCNKYSIQFCNACQLGKQIKLPFSKSNNSTSLPFEIIHSDLWTSPLPSLSGFRYYIVFLDDLTHYLWVYPIRRKSEVFSKFLHFSAYVKTQFGATI